MRPENEIIEENSHDIITLCSSIELVLNNLPDPDDAIKECCMYLLSEIERKTIAIFETSQERGTILCKVKEQ